MKKYLFLVATLAIVSCSESEKLNQDIKDTSKAPLAFSVYSDVITRATDAKNSTKLKDFHDAFAVYGWKKVGEGDAQEVFINTPNEYFTAKDGHGTYAYPSSGNATPQDEWAVPGTISSENGYWYYENIRYWDKLATYEFFAIAPYDNSTNPYYSVASGSKNFSLYADEDGKRYDISTNEINLMADKPEKNLKYYRFNKDFMIAEKKSTTTVAQTVTAASQDVNLIFHHILSKLNVMIKKDENYSGKQPLVVTDLIIKNLKKEGSFVYNEAGITSNGWTTTGSYDISLIDKNYSLNSTTPADNYDECYWVENLIFPQDITCKKSYVDNAIEPQSNSTGLDNYLFIRYKIGTEVFEAYYDLANVFGVSTANTDYTFVQGSQYRLTIIVGPKPIHFTAEVKPWVEDIDPSADPSAHNIDAN